MTSCCLHLTLIYPLCEVLQLPPRNLLKPKALRLIRHEQGIIASQAELRTMGFSFLRPQKKQRKLSKNGTKFLKQHPWPRTIIHFNAT